MFAVIGAIADDVVAGLKDAAFTLEDFFYVEVVVVAAYMGVSCSTLNHPRECLSTKVP